VGTLGKKIDNFLPVRPGPGIVFFRKKSTTLPGNDAEPAFGVNGRDDSQIAPQAIEIAQNGLANDEPKGSCPVAKHFVSPKQGLRRRREVF
jgi:hypothetical protein